MSEIKCPNCGSEWAAYEGLSYVRFVCGSLQQDGELCDQSNTCRRLTTLERKLEEIAKALGITQCDPVKAESNDLFHHKGRGFLLRNEVPARCVEIINERERKLEEAKKWALRAEHHAWCGGPNGICTCGLDAFRAKGE